LYIWEVKKPAKRSKLLAVVSGDVISSISGRQPGANQATPLLENMLAWLAQLAKEAPGKALLAKPKAAQVAFGDRFQFVVPQGEKALRMALLCRCYLKSGEMQPKGEEARMDCRISISIQAGEDALDAAYISAGRGLDLLSHLGSTKIAFTNPPGNAAQNTERYLKQLLTSKYLLLIPPANAPISFDMWRLLSLTADSLVRHLSPGGAQTMGFALQGMGIAEVAKAIDPKKEISIQAAGKRFRTAQVRELMAVLHLFEKQLKQNEAMPI